jgi:excisionase family DNA binding protein
MNLQKDRMLSIRDVAETLNLSRQYVVALADAGKLGVAERGKAGERRIPAAAVEKFRSEQVAKARNGLDELAAISQKAGLYSSESKKA